MWINLIYRLKLWIEPRIKKKDKERNVNTWTELCLNTTISSILSKISKIKKTTTMIYKKIGINDWLIKYE